MKTTSETELSEAQRLAVETVGKNLCVSAGAGSGKTKVLVERFLNLVTHHGISPKAILAITFTDKAASEMKSRIVERFRDEGLEEARREVENAYISTIHAFAARLLREHPVEAGVDPNFQILESHEADLLQEQALSDAIERLAAENNIFDLLRIYSEDVIRKDILSIFETSRHWVGSFEEILKKRPVVDPEVFQFQIERALRQLGQTEKIPYDIPSLLALNSKFPRAAGKQKEIIIELRQAISTLVAYVREEENIGLRESFIRLALEFEKSYEAMKVRERLLDFDDLQRRAVRLLAAPTPAAKALLKIYQERFREILVDEFQDINQLQNSLLELLQGDRSNLFIVGDLKQSIYGFRGARVELFLEKGEQFNREKAGIRIRLSTNYRSQPALLEFVNSFFEILWQEDGLPFEKLDPFRLSEHEEPPIERLLLKKKEKETADEMRIREARWLAQRIRQLVTEGRFSYKDIACLFEKMTNVHFYEQEFRRAGIPYHVVSTRGFYSQPEIRDVISFLWVLENPRRDISLAAALRSPLFQISDDTLAGLARSAKEKKKENPLAGSVFQFEAIPEIPEEEKEKLRFFKLTFEEFLKEKENPRISDLIDKLLRRTSYDLYVFRMTHGDRRYGNLRKLVEIARRWESKETITLGAFVSRIKGLETQQVRESQAQIETEKGDVVKLLTIHTAKGLEFPIVILPDLGTKDKSEDARFLITQEEGLGLKVRGDTLKIGEETLTFSRNRLRLQRSSSEESKRLLYVAMTRAREKLILSGPSAEPKENSFHDLSTWAQWVERVVREEKPWNFQITPEPPAFSFGNARKALAERKSLRSRLEKGEPIRLRDEPPQAEELFNRLTALPRVFFKRIDLPVSAFLAFVKNPQAYLEAYEIGVPQNYTTAGGLEMKPEEEWTETEEPTAAEFGTRVHRILEEVLLHRHVDPDRILLRLTRDLSEKKREQIGEMVRRFLKSGLAKEISSAPRIFPELPFVLRLPHGMIHGVMDLVYRRPSGEWVIVDYKTSEVLRDNAAEKAKEYQTQIELYALALYQIAGKVPAEAKLQFLKPGVSHRWTFTEGQMKELSEKFASLQEKILEFRPAQIDAE